MTGNSKKYCKNKIVLGVDVGTTNIRCFAYNQFAHVIGSAQEKLSILEEDGRHEIEPGVLWKAFLIVVKACLACSQLKAEDVTCLGISTQRASFITWDKNTNKPFHNFITWKDRRTDNWCKKWNASFLMKVLRLGARLLYFITRKQIFQVASVLNLTSSMVLTRLYWIINHNKKVQEKILKNEVLFGAIDTWLVWKLTGGEVHATDCTNACVTGFFDIFKMQWMNWLLNILKIPTNILPVIKNTSDSFGHTLPEIFEGSIPICALVGDQQASMFGTGCFKEHDINCTMGTGSFLNLNTGLFPKTSINGVYPLVAWVISSKPTYMVETCVQDVGTMLSLAQNLGFFEHASDSSLIAQSVSGSEDVYFVPSCTLWQTAAEKIASIIGLRSTTSREQVVRSILEAIAFQICLLSDIMKSYGVKETKAFRICGGVSQNEFVLQLISNLLDKPVVRLKHYECSSIGAAFFAGLYCGVWKNIDEITSLEMECDWFYPNALSTAESRGRYNKWKYAVYHPIPNIF